MNVTPITPVTIALLLASLTVTNLHADDAAPAFSEVKIISTADGSNQPARWYAPKDTADPRPLLIVLHTWGGDYRQKGFGDEALLECAKRGWALMHPNFRGANNKPDACASPLAMADVLDAIAYAKANASIDADRIYLLGTSGGGHMALMMACNSPTLFAGVSAWVPPTDLAAWHQENVRAGRGYARDLEKICGGKPGESKDIDAQYRARSPLFHLGNAKRLPIDINAGIHDGHTGSIPVSHSIAAFNRLAQANGQPRKQLTQAHIEHIVKKRTIPVALQKEAEKDDTRKRAVIFRRSAGPARLTLFEGTHEGDTGGAIEWLSEQKR